MPVEVAGLNFPGTCPACKAHPFNLTVSIRCEGPEEHAVARIGIRCGDCEHVVSSTTMELKQCQKCGSERIGLVAGQGDDGERVFGFKCRSCGHVKELTLTAPKGLEA